MGETLPDKALLASPNSPALWKNLEYQQLRTVVVESCLSLIAKHGGDAC